MLRDNIIKANDSKYEQLNNSMCSMSWGAAVQLDFCALRVNSVENDQFIALFSEFKVNNDTFFIRTEKK